MYKQTYPELTLKRMFDRIFSIFESIENVFNVFHIIYVHACKYIG